MPLLNGISFHTFDFAGTYLKTIIGLAAMSLRQ
jgi:hypothetical protein